MVVQEVMEMRSTIKTEHICRHVSVQHEFVAMMTIGIM